MVGIRIEILFFSFFLQSSIESLSYIVIFQKLIQQLKCLRRAVDRHFYKLPEFQNNVILSRYVSRVVKQQKILSSIWQHFSCILDKGIPKICKKLNFHDGFLSYLLISTANSAHLAAHFCPALVCPQKAIVIIQFLAYF